MNYRQILKAQLHVDENTIPYAYQDSEGFWTIGTGRLIDKRKGGKLRPDEMALMLDNDIIDAERDALAVFKGFEYLTDNRKAVCCNMAFNLGRDRLLGFQNFIAAVGAGDWKLAAAEMLDSLWAKQVGDRAQRLAKLMENG